MSWGMVAVAGASLIGGKLASDAQKDQSKIQANAIKNSQGISAEATRKAVNAMLENINPALTAFNDSLSGSIDLFNQGRVSTPQILQQGFQSASNIMAQGGNNAMSALLGIPPQQLALPEVKQQISQTLPDTPASQQIVSSGLLPPRSATNELSGVNDGIAQQAGLGSQPQAGLGGTNMQAIDNAPVYKQDQLAAVAPDNLNIAGSQAGIGPSQAAQQYQPINANVNQMNAQPLQQQALSAPQSNAGMIGAEQALTTGANLGRQDMIAGTSAGLDSLSNQFNQAAQTRLAGGEFGLNQLQQAMGLADKGFGQAVNTIQQGAQAGANAAQAGAAQGVGFLQPYMAAGQEALDPYMNLSGARGQEAFDKALINDPSYNYALQQSEQALGRNAALTGMFGSGNIYNQLQENAQGMAAQNIDRQLGRYMPIIQGGQNAASTAGQFTTSAGNTAGNILASGAQSAGNLQAQGGQFGAGLKQAMASVGINTAQDLANYAAQQGITEQQALTQLGQNLGNINIGLGSAIGGLRQQTGLAAADLINQNANNQAQLQTGLSSNLANIDQQTLNNIINSIQSGASTQLGTATNLAGMLSNAYTGQGNQAVQLNNQLGQAQAAGVTNPIGNAINTGIGLFASGAMGGLGSNKMNPVTTGSPYQQTATVM